jgi:DNA (cytosine-5)-methyltransferase 1
MKAVSLFSGIGGFDLGLERAGIEIVLQVEIDEFCRRVLAKHWPDLRRIADVRDVTAEDCDGADLIFGGFPCQPVSVAGKRLGAEDERWLWPEFARLLGLVRPRFALVENVPGLFDAGFDEVLTDLAALGYDASWNAGEPRVGRVAHGVPGAVARLHALGNAVVPQVAELIGRRLMEIAS